MTLRADPKYPSRRTYVVKLRSDATPDALCGRLENLVTCKQSDFTSARELFDLIARDIDSCGAEPPATLAARSRIAFARRLRLRRFSDPLRRSPISDQTPTLL